MQALGHLAPTTTYVPFLRTAPGLAFCPGGAPAVLGRPEHFNLVAYMSTYIARRFGGLTVLFICAGSRVDYALAQSSNHAGRAAITRLSCIDACTGALSLPREQIDTLWLVPSSDPSPSPCLLSRVTTILETRSNPALNKLCLLPSSARLPRHR